MVDGWTVPGFTHVRELGRGASGRVMLAVDDVTQTTVAIKYLDPRLQADERFMTRYRADARKLSQLEDPNVIDLYEFVEAPDGRSAAVVMERVGGVSMRMVLDTQGPTGPLAALAVLSGTLLGLAAAHGIGVVHRDVKPSNIMINEEGNCRVTDFGIVPGGAGGQGAGPPGSPGYLAPELWDGAPPSAAADIYAATVIFFECLTGHLPYDSRSQPAKAHREAPVPADAVPGPLRSIVAQGMAKDPAKRAASAADFLGTVEEAAVAAYGPAWEAQGRSRLTEMGEAAAGAPKPAAPAAVTAGTDRGARRSRSGRVAAAGVAALVVGAAILGATVVYGMDQDDTGTTPAGRTASPLPEPSPNPSQPSASPSQPADLNPAVLAQRIGQAAEARASAGFTFRRTGCCAPAATAQGTFRLASGPDSYQMTLSSSTAELRRTTPTVLVGETGYVRLGSAWQAVPNAGSQNRGFAALAARVRWSGSVSNVTTLLAASDPLRRSGRTYRGNVVMTKLTGDAEAGAFYTELARLTKAKRVGFVLTLDKGNLPRQLRISLSSTGRPLVLVTTYTNWGRKVQITPPR